MAYVERSPDYVNDRTMSVPTANNHDQVRWGSIFAGLVTALSTQLLLSALGAAIGLSSIGASGAPRSDAPEVGATIGIWSIISLLISLFIGGWMTSRASGRTGRNTALLNGVILWASVLSLSAWLLSSGVSGAFGVATANAGNMMNQGQQTMSNGVPQSGNQAQQTTPNNAPPITAEQTRDVAGNAAKVGWSFVLGSILGLGSSLLGAASGSRHPRTTSSDRD